MAKPFVVIQNWTVCNGDGYKFMRGQVIGHPDFTNGDVIRTSRIVNIDLDNDEVETLNTIYKLL